MEVYKQIIALERPRFIVWSFTLLANDFKTITKISSNAMNYQQNFKLYLDSKLKSEFKN